MREIPDKRKRRVLLKGLASEKIMRILVQRGFREARKAALASLQAMTPY
jgi:hypothetical protein